ncbi:MAG: lipid A deacylase LpxR family protein [Cellvibrionaceae bacterium]|nr:lipid A deacylase LpxR family protein [Cellvibrionaceae bacterium]
MFENDVFFQEDGGYTNGFSLAYGSGGFDQLDDSNTWRLWLPLIRLSHIDNYANRTYAVSHLIGQVMNTPEDITVAEVIEDQQPYSGITLLRNNFHSFDGILSDRLGVYFGLVGPLSYAEQAQRFVHELTDGTEPAGWDNQLENELVFKIELARSRKLLQKRASDKLVFELISSTNVGVGNLSSDLGLGIGFRLGTKLSEVVNIATELPGREINPMALNAGFNWYVFAAVLGKYVFNDISIDGNTFRDSHSVELNHRQALLSYGFAVSFNRWVVGYTSARSSKTYRSQPESANFGAINITYMF